MNVADNKFLIVKPSVRLTPHIIPVIVGMDKYFEQAGLQAYVTRGQSSSMDQLKIIVQYAIRYDVHKEFPEILSCLPGDKREGEYVWQRAWSRLLNLGVIINPPFPAKVLFDYFRNKVNKKGTIIGHSPHFYGLAYDIGGGPNHGIEDELKVVEKAYAEGLPGLKGYLPERKNNCIHCDVDKVIIQ